MPDESLVKQTKIRLPLSQLEVGMVAAEDVINSTGLLVLPKFSEINQTHIFRLNLYQIFNVLVFKKVEETAKEEISFEPEKLPPNVDPKAFRDFSQEYESTNFYAQKCLDDICKGNNVNSSDLFQISNNLLDKLHTTSDLFSFIHHVKSRNDHLFTHSMNVSMFCNIFGKWLKLPPDEIKDLTIAGLIHDIGKTQIDVEILNKPGKLTNDEFEIIKKHPLFGFDMIKDKDFSYEVKMAVLLHHEKFDGSGYPFGFKNAQLSKFSKIVAITDIYDAMTSERSYRKRSSPFKVIEMFEKEAYNVLDTTYLFIFLENIAQNYIGTSVRLSNEETGKIIFINKKYPSRPLIDVGGKILNLETEKSLKILEII